MSMISSHCPDLVLLDLGLPDMDGTEIISSVRSWTQLPIIVVSARTHEQDKVHSLDLGADDYLTKPFGSAELRARVRVALRHSRSAPGTVIDNGVFTSGELSVDYNKHQVKINGENVGLTQNEFRLVALLAKNAGKVLTYDFIMRELWGPQLKGSNQIWRISAARSKKTPPRRNISSPRWASDTV